MDIWELMSHNAMVIVVLGILAGFSVFSWTVILSKWQSFRGARKANTRFLRAFRKATGFEAVMVASEQFRPSPLVAVFDFGYEEVERQVKSRGSVKNRAALERTIQLGISEEIAKLERNLNWLATTASVCPFIGLFGTVLGIISAFHGTGQEPGQRQLEERGAGHRRGAHHHRGGTRAPPFRPLFSTTSSARRSARWARAWTISRWNSST